MNSRMFSVLLIALAACSQFKEFDGEADATEASVSEDAPLSETVVADAAGNDTAEDGASADAATDAADPCSAACGIGAVCVDGGCDRVTDISSVSQHTCALRSGGHVVCWGSNNSFQLGHQGPGLPIAGVDDATNIATGSYFSCFRRTGGGVGCVGSITAVTATDSQVAGITDAVEVAGGAGYACVRHSTGAVSCWGDNLYGQIGDGTVENVRRAPVASLGIVDADMIALGWMVSCARRRSGQLLCWGYPSLGDGAPAHSVPMPTVVAGVTDVHGLCLGRQHVCVLHSDGTVDCWGSSSNGQLGTGTAGTTINTPVRLPGVTDAVEVSCGGRHTCVRTRSGQVLCTGSNNNGQIGDGTNVDRSTLVPVTGVTGAIRVAAADDHTCALLGSGQVFCWGANEYGQLGDGRTIDSAVPVRVVGLP
jgi:alpha-tubulin suppressor-like RCC1 family protein